MRKSINNGNFHYRNSIEGLAGELCRYTPHHDKGIIMRIWSRYDKEADVLYLNFKKPSHADDSELTEDDIIIRYEKDEVVGITILNASKRKITG